EEPPLLELVHEMDLELGHALPTDEAEAAGREHQVTVRVERVGGCLQELPLALELLVETKQLLARQDSSARGVRAPFDARLRHFERSFEAAFGDRSPQRTPEPDVVFFGHDSPSRAPTRPAARRPSPQGPLERPTQGHVEDLA